MTDSGQIAIIIEYGILPENRERFLDVLHRNCADTLKDEGCLRMEIAEPIGGDGTTVFLTERWRDQDSIDKHRAKPGHDQSHLDVDRLTDRKRVSKCRIVGG